MAILNENGLTWFTNLFKSYFGANRSLCCDTQYSQISSGDSLNDYTSIGNYYCRPDSVASSVSNSPSDRSFILRVYSGVGRSSETSNGNYLTQCLENNCGVVWKRYKSTGSWSDWKQFITNNLSDIGSGTNPIYIASNEFVESNSTVGSSTVPIYMNSGTFTASGSTVGSSTVPTYLNSGKFTAFSSTVGSNTVPTYLSSGKFTASTSTVGDATTPIYMNSGTLTASSSSVGSSTNPIYLNSGTISTLSSTVGSTTKPVYLSSGTFTASSSTVGSSSTPIYLKSGTFTACSDSLGDLSIDSYSLNMPGYVKFSIGLIIQWGTRNTSANSTTSMEYTVTFPISFSSADSYSIVKNPKINYSSALYIREACFFNKTARKATARESDNTDIDEEWLAIGT